jgi:hypothetical protein
MNTNPAIFKARASGALLSGIPSSLFALLVHLP